MASLLFIGGRFAILSHPFPSWLANFGTLTGFGANRLRTMRQIQFLSFSPHSRFDSAIICSRDLPESDFGWMDGFHAFPSLMGQFAFSTNGS
jgi:hypothetical protein